MESPKVRAVREDWQNTHPESTQRKDSMTTTTTDLAALLAEQDGRCAVCGTDDPDAGLHIDRNPHAGARHGVLCLRCDAMLEAFNYDPAILDAAAAYIKYWKDRHRREAQDGLAHELRG